MLLPLSEMIRVSQAAHNVFCFLTYINIRFAHQKLDVSEVLFVFISYLISSPFSLTFSVLHSRTFLLSETLTAKVWRPNCSIHLEWPGCRNKACSMWPTHTTTRSDDAPLFHIKVFIWKENPKMSVILNLNLLLMLWLIDAELSRETFFNQ